MMQIALIIFLVAMATAFGFGCRKEEAGPRFVPSTSPPPQPSSAPTPPPQRNY